MKLSAYTSRIPGMTAYTPNYQLHAPQSPNLAGLGANETALPATDLLTKAKQLISDNPMPVLLLIGALLLKK